MRIEIAVGSSRHRDGLAAISLDVRELDLSYQLDLQFKELSQRCGIPDLITLDFLMIASLCYVVDKIVSRGIFPDKWTRVFEIENPVSDPDLWNGVVADLEAALGFLTGDTWQLSFRALDTAFFRRPRRQRRRRRAIIPGANVMPSAVCLFSGGVDSLTGTIDLLVGEDHQKVLLIGHYDAAGPRAQQQNLFNEISRWYPRRAELLQTRISHTPSAALESTLRSRSLIFIALGIYAARASGTDVPVVAPENGFIAINVPLTPSRLGSCSTRTMHPFFLDTLRAVLRNVGLTNGLINPLELKTKGECALQCRNRLLLESAVNASVSCSHWTRRQNWFRKGANNCGYCVPCIVRRAALHKAGLDDGQAYGIDICEGELPPDDQRESADDLRAVLDALLNRKAAGVLAREISAVAPVSHLEEYAAMVDRGFDEIRIFLRDKARSSVRRAAGV